MCSIALRSGPYPSLLTFDVEAAKARVEKLPWVKEATLKKLYPHGLEVAVTERQPFAVWQHGDTVWLVDDTGKVITDQVSDRYAALPLVVGDGAAERVGEFVNMVSAFPDIADRVHAGVLISGRRWTIVLDNGIELMLPEEDPIAALQKIAAPRRQRPAPVARDRRRRHADGPVGRPPRRQGGRGAQGDAQGKRRSARGRTRDRPLPPIRNQGRRGAPGHCRLGARRRLDQGLLPDRAAEAERSGRGAAGRDPLHRGAGLRPSARARHQVGRRGRSRRCRAVDPARR